MGKILSRRIKCYSLLDYYAQCAYNEGMIFQWDSGKAGSNRRKHGVEFADAVAIFEDEMALTIEDPDAVGECRFISIGRGATGQVMTVVYTMRDESIRIISARPATRQERKNYEEEI